MRRELKLRWTSLITVLLVIPVSVAAQHPVDVQRLHAEGEHLRALEVYEKLPDRRLGTDTHVAAAHSYWALGLSQQAAHLFDSVLRTDGLANEERARITFSRGIIEYQEERYQEAALYAEKTCNHLPEKAPLRGRAFLLWGQSLLRSHAYVSAEEKLWRALAEVSPQDRPDVAITLATVQIKLGKPQEAERALKAIPTEHVLAPEAVRLLASIAMQTDRNDRAAFWLHKAKTDYSAAFLDSWGDYAQVSVALKDGDMPRARKLVELARNKLPPSDAWLIVMQASLEQAEWNGRKERQKD